jgi:hypothetical protein
MPIKARTPKKRKTAPKAASASATRTKKSTAKTTARSTRKSTAKPATRATRSKSTASPTKKSASTKKSTRYGSLASDKVEKAVHEMKEGTLRSGRSGKKVTSRKQAIAIGLSEARRKGGKVPSAPKKSK